MPWTGGCRSFGCACVPSFEVERSIANWKRNFRIISRARPKRTGAPVSPRPGCSASLNTEPPRFSRQMRFGPTEQGSAAPMAGTGASGSEPGGAILKRGDPFARGIPLSAAGGVSGDPAREHSRDVNRAFATHNLCGVVRGRRVKVPMTAGAVRAGDVVCSLGGIAPQLVCNRERAEADGGESGIRTHGRVSPTHAFQACSFNHSDISPLQNQRVTGCQESIITEMCQPS